MFNKNFSNKITIVFILKLRNGYKISKYIKTKTN